MESLLQQFLSHIDAEEPLTSLLSILSQRSNEEIASVLLELNCLALFSKEIKTHIVKLCQNEVFYHKNRHLLQSILSIIRSQSEKYYEQLIEYCDAMDHSYINGVSSLEDDQDIRSKEKQLRLQLKERETQWTDTIKILSEELNSQIELELEVKAFFQKSINTINDFISDGIFPLINYKNTLTAIGNITHQSYYIKTKNRTPLILDLGFSKFMYKDDRLLSHEVIAKNIISFLAINLPEIKIKTYEIIPLSKGALYEFIQESLTVSEIKKQSNNSLKDYFKSLKGENVQKNFCESYAGFCIVQYVLMLTDRHNENIMLTQNGEIFHIDLAYIYQMKVGKMRFQSAPFKFPEEYKGLMEGDNFKYWQQLLIKGFQTIITIIPELMTRLKSMMKIKQLQCFNGFSFQKYRARFPSNKQNVEKFVQKLIYDSFNAFSTRHYDKFQHTSNGILY